MFTDDWSHIPTAVLHFLDITDRMVHENALDGARRTPGMVHGKTLEMVQDLRAQLSGLPPEAYHRGRALLGRNP